VLALGVFGGVLGGPVGGVFMADARSSNDAHVKVDACGPSSAPRLGTHDPTANQTSSSTVEAQRIAPESPASSSGRVVAPSRGEQAEEIEVGVGSWAHVLETHRPRLEDCLAMAGSSTTMPKISVVIDGPSGRFRNVEPVQLRGRARRCLQDTLASLEFAASPARIELTIGLPQSPNPRALMAPKRSGATDH